MKNLKDTNYQIPKWIVKTTTALFIIFFLTGVVDYFKQDEIIDCDDIANDALEYYENEIDPFFIGNITDFDEKPLVSKLNKYLNMSKDFYICMQERT